jgi:hypothetical protein
MINMRCHRGKETEGSRQEVRSKSGSEYGLLHGAPTKILNLGETHLSSGQSCL